MSDGEPEGATHDANQGITGILRRKSYIVEGWRPLCACNVESLVGTCKRQPRRTPLRNNDVHT